MNEHQLQKFLTHQWVRNGVTIDGERFFLAAWEVMDNYRINSRQQGFTHPSIDFLLLDEAGFMVALELKMSVKRPLDSWNVLCQVTHRAVVLAKSYTAGALEFAYRSCRSGDVGRVSGAVDVLPLRQAHARFFDREQVAVLPGPPIRRVVAAPSFGPSWDGIRERFTTEDRNSIAEQLRRYADSRKRGTEMYRWLSIPATAVESLPPQVTTLQVEIPSHQ